MKNWWMAFLAGAALAASASAQTSSPGNQAAGGPSSTPVLSGGTGVVAELTKSLNAKKAKPGNSVRAVVVQDVVSHGQIVIRAGSKLLGRLTLVKASSKDDPGSRLGIAFESVALKRGGDMPLDAVIRALGPPTKTPSRVDLPDPMLPPGLIAGGSMGNTAPQPLGRSTAARGGRATEASTSAPTAQNRNSAGRNGVDVPANMGGTSKGPDNALVLSPQSRGVFGLPKLGLYEGKAKDCVIFSQRENVKLESDSQIVLEVNGAAEK